MSQSGGPGSPVSRRLGRPTGSRLPPRPRPPAGNRRRSRPPPPQESAAGGWQSAPQAPSHPPRHRPPAAPSWQSAPQQPQAPTAASWQSAPKAPQPPERAATPAALVDGEPHVHRAGAGSRRATSTRTCPTASIAYVIDIIAMFFVYILIGIVAVAHLRRRSGDFIQSTDHPVDAVPGRSRLRRHRRRLLRLPVEQPTGHRGHEASWACRSVSESDGRSITYGQAGIRLAVIGPQIVIGIVTAYRRRASACWASSASSGSSYVLCSIASEPDQAGHPRSVRAHDHGQGRAPRRLTRRSHASLDPGCSRGRRGVVVHGVVHTGPGGCGRRRRSAAELVDKAVDRPVRPAGIIFLARRGSDGPGAPRSHQGGPGPRRSLRALSCVRGGALCPASPVPPPWRSRLDALEAAVRDRSSLVPRLALVLGSGLGGLADTIEDPVAIPFAELPGWPAASAPGHSGRLLLGHLEGVPVACLQGRLHMYEGLSALQVVEPVLLLHRLGADTLLLTNAAGGVNHAFPRGHADAPLGPPQPDRPDAAAGP